MDYYLLTDLAATMGYHMAMSGQKPSGWRTPSTGSWEPTA